MKQHLITVLSALCFLTFTMTSCQKEESVTPNSQLTFRAPPACNPANPTWTNNAPCAGEDLTVTFCVSATCGLQQMFYEVAPNDWVKVAQEQPTDGCVTYTIPNAAAGAYKFQGHYNGNAGGCGQNVCNVGQNDYTYTVNVIACGCDDELTADVACTSDACNRSVTFTYTAGDDYDAIVVQGGLTHFTTICTATATGGLVRNTTHNSVLNSNANVTRWEASGVEECDELTVTITWTSTNNASLITGQWTVKDGDGNLLAYVCPLDCAGNSAEVCE